MRKINVDNYRGSLKVNKSYEAESIEMKVKRVMANNEPIDDGAPIIYTERKDGVKAEYNVRTDRFDIAVEAMDKVAKSKVAKRIEFFKEKGVNKDAPSAANTSDNLQ